jgi:hypothetical protein
MGLRRAQQLTMPQVTCDALHELDMWIWFDVFIAAQVSQDHSRNYVGHGAVAFMAPESSVSQRESSNKFVGRSALLDGGPLPRPSPIAATLVRQSPAAARLHRIGHATAYWNSQPPPTNSSESHIIGPQVTRCGRPYHDLALSRLGHSDSQSPKMRLVPCREVRAQGARTHGGITTASCDTPKTPAESQLRLSRESRKV